MGRPVAGAAVQRDGRSPARRLGGSVARRLGEDAVMDPLHTLETPAGTYAVRRAGSDDLPGLVALLSADAVAAARGDSVGDLAPYRRAFTVIDASPDQLLACLDAPDGALAGTLQLTFVPGLSRRGATRAQIESVRIAEAVRGAGLGSAFLRWAVDHARREGCGVVQLTTDASRLDAQRFYRRLGFEHTHHGYKLVLDRP